MIPYHNSNAPSTRTAVGQVKAWLDYVRTDILRSVIALVVISTFLSSTYMIVKPCSNPLLGPKELQDRGCFPTGAVGVEYKPFPFAQYAYLSASARRATELSVTKAAEEEGTYKNWLMERKSEESTEGKKRRYRELRGELKNGAKLEKATLAKGGTKRTNSPDCDTFIDTQVRARRVMMTPKDIAAAAPLYANTSNNIYFVNPYENFAFSDLLCSIESALIHNPYRTITFYTGSPKKFTEVLNSIIEQEGKLNPEAARSATRMKANVLVSSLPSNFMRVIAQTPLVATFQRYFAEQEELSVDFVVAAFQLALVYRYGGTAMGLDVISLGPLGMGISADGARPLMESFLSFEKGDELAWSLMQKMSKLNDKANSTSMVDFFKLATEAACRVETELCLHHATDDISAINLIPFSRYDIFLSTFRKSCQLVQKVATQ
ncbi:hypothetical protein HK101_001282 [Irineochytrium annulatum]|nr:hypothetical protein HK101_001282 [Irineochytrium annulatum]